MKNPLLFEFIYRFISKRNELHQLFRGFFDGVKIDIQHDLIEIGNDLGNGLSVFDIYFAVGNFDPGAKQSMAIIT